MRINTFVRYFKSLFYYLISLGYCFPRASNIFYYNKLLFFRALYFDFCDATPPATAPFVDFNFGTIAPTITYCTVSIAENSNKTNISFYPSPTKGMVYFGEKYQLEIYNAVGQLLKQSTSQQINISDFPSGIYLVVVKDLGGTQLAFDKLIKE